MPNYPFHPRPPPNTQALDLGSFGENPTSEAGHQLYIGELPSNIMPPGYVRNSEGLVRRLVPHSMDTQFPVAYPEVLASGVMFTRNSPAERGATALFPVNPPLVETALGSVPGPAYPGVPVVSDAVGSSIPSF
jgi:hypothetical protein